MGLPASLVGASIRRWRESVAVSVSSSRRSVIAPSKLGRCAGSAAQQRSIRSTYAAQPSKVPPCGCAGMSGRWPFSDTDTIICRTTDRLSQTVAVNSRISHWNGFEEATWPHKPPTKIPHEHDKLQSRTRHLFTATELPLRLYSKIAKVHSEARSRR